jgi:hypothetical protein
MKHKHTTNTVGYTTPWARVVVALMLFGAFVLGATPERALADKIVVINQPDDYIVLDPIAAERHSRRIIVEEPEPSWVVVGTAPPSLRFEVRPRRPFPGAVWVSGYWWWSGVRYVWIGGHYVRPLAGYRFVAPRWVCSGGYYYHVRGHYRPAGATVRHPRYRHYRQVGYYGHRYPQGYLYTTRRSYPQAPGPRYRAHDDKPRGHGKGHYRTHGAHDGRGEHFTELMSRSFARACRWSTYRSEPTVRDLKPRAGGSSAVALSFLERRSRIRHGRGHRPQRPGRLRRKLGAASQGQLFQASA